MTGAVGFPHLLDPRTRRVAVSICGIGGQGIVLAGVILGQAAVESGIWASQSSAYTVAARGGFTRSEVILAPTEQPCPIVEEADVIVALAEEGWAGDKGRLKEGGIALCEEGLSPLDAGARTGQAGGPAAAAGAAGVVTVPFSLIADDAGQSRSINVVALGVLAGLTGLVPETNLRGAVEANLGPRGSEALTAGLRAGAALRGKIRL